MKEDKILITVLDDGSIKVQTSAVSSANHTNAAGALRELEAKLGGETKHEKLAPNQQRKQIQAIALAVEN